MASEKTVRESGMGLPHSFKKVYLKEKGCETAVGFTSFFVE